MKRYAIISLSIIICLVLLEAAHGQQSNPLKSLDGTWLAERADNDINSCLPSAWRSTFVIKDGAFRVTHCGSSKDLVGSISLVSGRKNAIDLNVEAIDLSSTKRGHLGAQNGVILEHKTGSSWSTKRGHPGAQNG